jgi:DNA-binding CsgD family transcriptional regulator
VPEEIIGDPAVLHPLRLGPVTVDRARYLPPMLLPLVRAATRGDDIVPAVQSVVRAFGFDSFMYATANYHLRPDNDERMYVFTTLPREWVIRYDQNAYVECDPRVVASFDNALPLMWDQVSEGNRSARTDEFLADAAAHGVASGVAFPVYATYPSRNIVALNSPAPVIAKERRDEITRMLGEIVLFGQYFHELFVKGVIERGMKPSSEGAPLSNREKHCLQLASRGLTSAEIANRLGIADRTVHFHFANILSKLAARNRHEAIAKAAGLGLL